MVGTVNRAQMQAAAEAKELDGWLVTLEFPSYYAVMTYADDRALRVRGPEVDAAPDAGVDDLLERVREAVEAPVRTWQVSVCSSSTS